MAMTGNKVKLTTEETLASPDKVTTSRFPAANVSAIWLNVFDKLDPQDKLTFARADSEWHDLVDSKRTQFFYPEVVPILTRIYSLKDTEPQQLSFREVAPIDPELLPRKHSLKCRELSKLWNLEWDRQTVTHPSNLTLEFEMAAAEFWNIPDYTTRFRSAVEIQQFLKDMENHPGNPFPGRYIRLSWFEKVTNEDKARLHHEYGNAVVLLLEKFGKHVHYSNILLTQICGGGLNNKVLLRNALLHLPHLRKLEIYDDNEFEISSQVDEFYRQNPLPLLENLETLIFRYVGTAMIKSVLNYCCLAPAIKRLQLESLPDYHLGQFDAVYNFRNLEVLSAPLVIRDLERFSSQREVPPLRELSLQWMKRPTFQRLLKALEPFGNTLRRLKMDSILVGCDHYEEPRTINLSNLSEISIGCYEGPLDPLVQLTALTKIKLFKVKNPRRPRKMLGLHELEQQMKKSNIWGLIPSLEEFLLKHKTFYRSDVEKPEAGEGKASN